MSGLDIEANGPQNCEETPRHFQGIFCLFLQLNALSSVESQPFSLGEEGTNCPSDCILCKHVDNNKPASAFTTHGHPSAGRLFFSFQQLWNASSDKVNSHKVNCQHKAATKFSRHRIIIPWGNSRITHFVLFGRDFSGASRTGQSQYSQCSEKKGQPF